MAGVSGKYRRVSVSRRMIVDLMYFSNSVPFVSMERSVRFDDVAKAQEDHPDRPPWTALFAKAFAMTAEEFAVLRQTYFQFPFPYLYEYDESAVSIASEHYVDGEAGVLPVPIRRPDKLPLAVVQFKISEMSDDDLWRRGFYRTLAIVRCLPFFLRRPLWWFVLNVPRFRFRFFGTFAVTSVAALGADTLTPRAPVTSVLTYSPLGADGTIKMRLIFDHRVYDGATAARVLARMEEMLLGPILDEIKLGFRQ